MLQNVYYISLPYITAATTGIDMNAEITSLYK